MTELADWEKCYAMSQALENWSRAERDAKLDELVPELARLLGYAAEQLSPKGRAETARMS
jgi:hypothetical protein